MWFLSIILIILLFHPLPAKAFILDKNPEWLLSNTEKTIPLDYNKKLEILWAKLKAAINFDQQNSKQIIINKHDHIQLRPSTKLGLKLYVME